MIMMKANKQHFYSKMCFNLSTFLPIMLFFVLLSFFFSNSKSFTFLLAISIVVLFFVFLVTLKKKKGSKNESLVQNKLHEEELFDASESDFDQQSETAENHEEQDEAQLDYSFPLDSKSRNFYVMDETFEFNVHKHMQQDVLISDSSLSLDSEKCCGLIMDETFEIDHNRYQNVRNHDRLVSQSDLQYSSTQDLTTSDDDDGDDYDYDDDEEEDDDDSLIEIHLPSRNLSNLDEESKQNLESKFLEESILKQQSLIQILEEINDMNEDENLIEIDISMRSSKSNGQDFK